MITTLLFALVVAAGQSSPSETVYVSATKLHLRTAPSTSGKSLLRLPTNAPLRVLGRENKDDGEWLRVTIGDGREGFVASSMTSGTLLTVDAALAHANKARDAKDAKERVTWLERAAALSSTRDVLKELAVALRESGDATRAALLEQRVSWPEDIHLVAKVRDAKVVAIELPVEVTAPNHERDVEAYRLGGRDATEAERTAWGVVIGEKWWVLPAHGAAVRATVTGARLENFNECGGEWGATLELTLATPTTAAKSAGARAGAPAEYDRLVAATRRAEPPASWKTSTPALSDADVGGARAAVLEAIRAAKGPSGRSVGDAQVRITHDARGEIIARAWWLPPERAKPELEFYEQTNRVVSLKLVKAKDTKAGWRATIVDDTTGTHMNPNYPLSRRDIDGDGAFDTFLTDDCSVRVVMDAGTLKFDDPSTVVRAETTNRCCGC